MTDRCQLCIAPHDERPTHVITDNVLRDPRTIEVMGGPYCLDDPDASQVGMRVCSDHVAYVERLGYTVERLRVDAR